MGLRVLVFEDDVFKRDDVKRALVFSGVQKGQIDIARSQEKGIGLLNDSVKNGAPYDVIVTDMQYPLSDGADVDVEAGIKLIRHLGNERLDIPVIICSSGDYSTLEDEPLVLGAVLYGINYDINMPFKKLIDKLK